MDPGGRQINIRSAILDAGLRDADIAQATANLQGKLESFIREHPSQWMWAHRRWG